MLHSCCAICCVCANGADFAWAGDANEVDAGGGRRADGCVASAIPHPFRTVSLVLVEAGRSSLSVLAALDSSRGVLIDMSEVGCLFVHERHECSIFLFDFRPSKS